MSDYYDIDLEDYDEYEETYDENSEEDISCDNGASGFTQVPNSVLTDTNLSIHARLLYCTLLKHAWDKDFCFMTQDTLGGYLGLSSRRIRDYLKELKANDYINIHRHGYESPNFYELLVLPESKQYKKTYRNVFRKQRLKNVEKLIRTRRKKSSL